MQIAIAGAGYVGMANALLLAQQHSVRLFDIDPDKVAALNNGHVSLPDPAVADYMASHQLDFSATLDPVSAYRNAEIVIIATPTNYDTHSNNFDTSSIETTIAQVRAINSQALIVIRSTLPIGYTEQSIQTATTAPLIVCPEFLREESALYDSLYPTRIIVGGETELARSFADQLCQSAHKDNIPICLTNPSEAEAIKLFSNSYLAMRVAYFNELDSYANSHKLNTRQIIHGVCLDPRIGDYYNNPSFGYGGYCLPKDTKQLQSNYAKIPQNLILAIVESNATRKDFIAQSILQKNPTTIGIYRLLMSSSADNFRNSSIWGIIKRLQLSAIPIIIYEPLMTQCDALGITLEPDLARFKQSADLIVANRISDDLADIADKIYTRDLFGTDS